MAKQTDLHDALAISDLDKYVSENKETLSINWDFGNWDTVIKGVVTLLKTKDGLDILIKMNKGGTNQSYDLIFKDRSPDYQKYYQLQWIAKMDMIIQAVIFVRGNQPLPDELQDWNPTFGLEWQEKAKRLITSRENGWDSNPFWMKTYNEEIAPHISDGVVISKDGKVRLPIRAETIKDVELELVNKDTVVINIQGDSHIYPIDQVNHLWDNRSNKPNANGRIFIDLHHNLESCLTRDGILNQEFGQNSTPEKQMSKFAKALDGLVFIQDDRRKDAINRWFFKDTRFPELKWKPRFIFKNNADAIRTAMAEDYIENDLTPKQLAEKVVDGKYSREKELIRNGEMKIVHQKVTNLQNFYEDVPDK